MKIVDAAAAVAEEGPLAIITFVVFIKIRWSLRNLPAGWRALGDFDDDV